jgi:HSP20 family protein
LTPINAKISRRFMLMKPDLASGIDAGKEAKMTNITRNDPVMDLARAFGPFRDFEGPFAWPRLRHWLRELPGENAIKLDVTEDEKAYHVKAELPGVKKDDIAVEIDGSQVSLTAELKHEREEKKADLVHSERFYGRQYRSFTLGQDIDAKAAEAKFTDGVLDLTLPKSAVTASKRLAIQ